MNTDGRVGTARPSPRAIVAEVLLLLAVLIAFGWLHTQVVRDPAAATAHALDIQSTERTLHVNVELSANMWLSRQQALSVVAATVYRLYYLPLLAVLVWLSCVIPPATDGPAAS